MNDWQKTTCAFCATNCGLEVRTEGHRITKVLPEEIMGESPCRGM